MPSPRREKANCTPPPSWLTTTPAKPTAQPVSLRAVSGSMRKISAAIRMEKNVLVPTRMEAVTPEV